MSDIKWSNFEWAVGPGARPSLVGAARRARIDAITWQRSESATSVRHEQAIRRSKKTRKADEEAKQQAIAAALADRARAEDEAAAAHVAMMEAEVEERNACVADIFDQIDGLLAATIDVDDFVDLEMLRRPVEQLPFDHSDLETSTPAFPSIPDPVEPICRTVEPPTGLIGKKKKLAAAIAAADADHAHAVKVWTVEMDDVRARRRMAEDEHVRLESVRIAELARERARHGVENDAHQVEVAAHNAALDLLIDGLSHGTAEAVQVYVRIVLANSVYPDGFHVDYDFEFDPTTAELRIRVLVPAPKEIPDIKEHQYDAITDEITTTLLSYQDQKNRYTQAVQQSVIRSLHEIFEADRRALIHRISLALGTQADDQNIHVSLVTVVTDRDAFNSIDLSASPPESILRRLGAVVSSDPHGLVAISSS